MRPVQLADERFVSLITRRRNGDVVPTAVWVVADADDLLVWTVGGSGKVKRIRRDADVELRPCSRRGAVAEDAVRVTGRAVVSDDPADLARVQTLLRAKYGVEFLAVRTLERLLSRSRAQDRVVLRIGAVDS